ncbi:MAG: amine oxidase [Flavobacteriaceae bacterium]|nr:MAG: amine oxidase [Flavobacteriaceae bacterium]
MQRRKFIKNTLTGLPLLVLMPSVFSSCGEDEKVEEKVLSNGKKVIVIGAGISGLAAAKKLKSKGFEVQILEASDKVGGRLRTDRSLGFAFDQGASWIHGVNGNPITSLAKSAGMQTAITDDESFVSYDLGGIEHSDAVFASQETKFYNMLETLSGSGNLSQSFETVFASQYPSYTQDRLWKFFLSTYLTFDTGELNQLSSLYYNEGEEFGGEEVIATSGYDTIPNYLAKGLDVGTGQRVSKVDYTGSKVKITHNGKLSEADYVLVTVPLGVLKAGKISFTPSLPTNKQTAIDKLGMNCVNKFVLVWDKAFWDDVQYISYTPETKDKFNYFVNLKKTNGLNALMTFAYGDYARSTEIMGDAQIISEIMTHLRDIYGSQIPEPKSMLRTKWNSDENTLGAYSFTAVGTEMKHFEDLAEEVSGKLFFAGEHTEVDYFSTAHGAYLSGIREADKIIDLV